MGSGNENENENAVAVCMQGRDGLVTILFDFMHELKNSEFFSFRFHLNGQFWKI